MKDKFKGFNQTHFVLCGLALENVNNGGSITLPEGYFDNAGVFGDKGKYIKYVQGKSINGQDIPRRFKFDLSLRRLKTRDSDRDFYSRTMYDFLKNHPACEGSENGEYIQNGHDYIQVNVVFREADGEKDAEVMLEADELRIKAQADALSLDNQTLEEVANILGDYGNFEEFGKRMKQKVVEYAGKKPAEYMKLMESGDRQILALVRKSLNAGVFHKKGSVVYWDNTVVGTSENEAIATLMRDTNMIKALQEKLNVSLPIEVKRQRGNPSFGKKKPAETAKTE